LADVARGIGFETAFNFARHSPGRLILAVRNQQAVNDASAAIVTATKGKVVPEVWIVDLASFTSVRAFAKRCNFELDRLDIFVD
jgi:retinol dehydrogenase-12